MTTYTEGQKVRAKKDLVDEPDGDRPGCLCARKGDVLVVRAISAIKAWVVYVSHEHIHDKSFGVTEDEIEAIE